MKKYTLTTEYDFNFTLIAISCHAKDYYLTWQINSTLSLNFKRSDDLIIAGAAKDVKCNFSIYKFENEESHLSYFLISNFSENGSLIPELKNIDYFMIIKGVPSKSEVDNLVKSIKSLPSVLTVQLLDPNKIKSKHNLIFE